MERPVPADSRLYLGSVPDSMKHLPRWYQIISVGAVVLAVYFRNDPIISWLVVQLHSSFGTGWIWPTAYQDMLERMTFNERICFTLYGVALANGVIIAYKVMCQDTFNIGWPVTQLLPDHKAPMVVNFVMMCVVVVFQLRQLIARLLGDSFSLAHLALSRFKDIDTSPFDDRFAESNPHFIIQVELLKSFTARCILQLVCAGGIAWAYRFFRDVPRKTHVSLRWYMVTVAVVEVILELVKMYFTRNWGSEGTWAVLVWAAVYTAMVNFLYGPSRRAGSVMTASASISMTEASRGLLTCCGLWAVAALLVLTVVVSVHVVELIAIWLIITLLMVWVPSVVDSCSTDYMALLTLAACLIGHERGCPTKGCVRFGCLAFLWWLNISLLYNTVVNLARRRRVGVGLLLWFVLWFMSPSVSGGTGQPSARASSGFAADVADSGSFDDEMDESDSMASVELGDVAFALHARLDRISAITGFSTRSPSSSSSSLTGATAVDAVGDTFLGGSRSGSGNRFTEPHDAYSTLMESGVIVCAVLLLVNLLISRWQSAEVRAKLRRRNIILATGNVLLRKMVHTAVLLLCVISSLVSSEVCRRYVTPVMNQFTLVPNVVAHAVTWVVFCVVLGSLMDMNESLYSWIMRLLGLQDPPASGQESDGNDTINNADDSGEESGEDSTTIPAA